MSVHKKHLQFIEEYSVDTKRTNKDFARDFGVNEKTIYDWLKRYRKEIDEKICENVTYSKEKLLKNTDNAINKLVELITSTNDNVALGATKCLLETAGVKIERIEHSGNTGVNIQLVKPDNEE